MSAVIDTNIIFSMLLQEESQLRDCFFKEGTDFYAPNFVLLELFNKKEKLLKLSKLSESEISELLHRILQKIHFINEVTISKTNRIKAYQLCKEIDEEDTPFVALALEFNSEIWTGDEKLKQGLKKRGFHRFYIRQ